MSVGSILAQTLVSIGESSEFSLLTASQSYEQPSLLLNKLVGSQSNVVGGTKIDDPHTLQIDWIIMRMIWPLYCSRYTHKIYVANTYIYIYIYIYI